MDWTELEAAAFNAEKLASMALAIFDAMFEGPNHPENFKYAFDLLVSLILEHSKNLDALSDMARTPGQKEAANA